MIAILRHCKTRQKLNVIYASKSITDQNDKSNEAKVKQLPEVPTTCCMSGCHNCVWIDYADKLSEYYQDGGEHALQDIDRNISDPNLKAFILFQLRMRQKGE
ncbi:hypothetical protein PPYR_05705 [Photinus pyralis]|uniref:Oxidoreductase-like domain-containing protein n=1 Tax=Photinus pyralis TaxID=7054 RepID=A0A1Y1N004_PHOPY|nr:hypothetical protein PPYR_05705 [Photinus pyralis]